MQIRYLYVSFTNPLPPYKTEAFRGAVAHKVGLEHDWYHNHNNAETGADYHYRYPLIQYKSNGTTPVILYLGAAIEQAHHFFSQADWSLVIDREPYQVGIDQLKIQEFNMRLLETPYQYRLLNWLPLNQENYRIYQELESIGDKIKMLERILTNHILVMSEGVGWQPEDTVTATITALPKENFIKHKGQHLLALTFPFKTNIFIPEFVGLGRSVSHGFGVVRY